MSNQNEPRNNPSDTDTRDMNRDPISGAPGSHPVGVGVGGLAGGAAAGALAGTVFGPIGTLIGAGVGVIAGAAAGKSVAERIDPTGEDEYWRNEYQKRPYANKDYDYDRDYSAAYGYGLQARDQHGERGFDKSENELREGWSQARGESRLEWDEAREAARDSWNRADRTHNTYQESDRYFESRFQDAAYTSADDSYQDFRPAYRYGVFARTRYGEREWDDALDQQLGQDWDRNRGQSKLSWDRARAGVQDAYSSPYVDYNAGDTKSDYNQNESAGAGLFRVR